MEVTAVVARMSPEEARACVDQIKSNLEDVRARLFELHERDGWEALGYPTWQACIQAEFHLSKQRAHQLLNAHLVDRILAPPYEGSTTVDPGYQVAQIPERVTRELAPLIDQPDKLRDAWNTLVANDQKITADMARKAVDRRLGVERTQPIRRAPDPEIVDDYVEDVNQDFEDEPPETVADMVADGFVIPPRGLDPHRKAWYAAISPSHFTRLDPERVIATTEPRELERGLQSLDEAIAYLERLRAAGRATLGRTRLEVVQ